MAIATINGVSLRDDVRWVNQYDNALTTHNKKRALSGRLVVDSFSTTKGESLKLDCRWLERSIIDQLKAMNTSTPVTLIMPNLVQHNVIIESIEASEIHGFADYSDTDLIQTILNLTTV